jgi:Xaa-Pro dipeptidase
LKENPKHVTLPIDALQQGPSEKQRAELAEKYRRLIDYLDRNRFSAILISRHENIAWITAGQVEARVAAGSETAVTSLLLTRTGLRYYLAPQNEAPRLAAEEFAGLDYEPVLYPWHQNPAPLIRELVGDSALATDTPTAGATHVNLTSLRTPLLPEEIERLRIVSRATAEVTTGLLESLAPGITEQEMAARAASALLSRGLTPTVLLMAVDDRIRKYRHAVSRAGVLKRYATVNLCARKWGLVVSITRFVHFGAVPAELDAAFTTAARIHSELLHASRPGATSAQIFAVAQKAYSSLGVAEEIELHHQGGACGYTERDWVITPAGEETVVAPQAFAYNPSLRGAKVEDTAVLHNSPGGPSIEILTETPSLPVIETVLDGITYRSAGVLRR